MGYKSVEARRIAHKAWRDANREKVREYNRRWEEKNKERASATRKAYRRANWDRVLELKRLRYAADPAKAKAKYDAWTRANPEKYKAIQRNSVLKRAYGITLAERDAMLEAQGNACAICGAPEPGSKRGWHIDHCHSTKKVRGILCHHCNVSAGAAKDDPARLRMIADYLERHASS